MPFDSTVGGASANSLTSLTYAAAYFTDERIGGEAWVDDYSDAQREAALRQATRELERKAYKGKRTTSTQALSFPRGLIEKRDSASFTYYADDAIPDDVQKACCELAFDILKNNQADDSEGGLDLSAFKSVKLGEDSFVMREGQTDTLPKVVMAFLRDFILTSQASIVRG